MANLKDGALKGPQFYPYCFNIEIIGGGSAEPDGVKFPGAYKEDDYGIAFSPYEGIESGPGREVNSKYVSKDNCAR
jgi:Auxiliary Activity family 9 (formerly GH61)